MSLLHSFQFVWAYAPSMRIRISFSVFVITLSLTISHWTSTWAQFISIFTRVRGRKCLRIEAVTLNDIINVTLEMLLQFLILYLYHLQLQFEPITAIMYTIDFFLLCLNVSNVFIIVYDTRSTNWIFLQAITISLFNLDLLPGIKLLD